MERASWVSILEVMPRSLDILLSAGAIIEEATGEMKMKQDTTNVATHFLRMDQFLGFEGSVGEDHVTWRSCWLVLLLGVWGCGCPYQIWVFGRLLLFFFRFCQFL
jgi:hypothetical protein